MLLLGSSLKGYTIAASDGRVGTVSDLLFDDRRWKLRWLVADTGGWLSGRKVLIHPSVIGQVASAGQQISVKLSRTQIEGGPSLMQHQPVSLQMESELLRHYDWDPRWGDDCLGVGVITPPFEPPANFRQAEKREPTACHGDPHLRSFAAVEGYDVQATDGGIGHFEDLLIDDGSWCIRYLIIDTKNWRPGPHVLLSPNVVREIDWSEQQIRLDMACEQVKASASWDAIAMADQLDAGQRPGLEKGSGSDASETKAMEAVPTPVNPHAGAATAAG